MKILFGDIEQVSAGYSGLTIRRRGGRPVVAWAVQKSNIGSWSHKATRADAIAKIIRARIGLADA